MNRRRFLQTAAAPAVLHAQAGRERPNIILLLTDDQRWDSLGCAGNGIVRTPNIDRLAERGVTFENHFVTTAICMTSRASIFTGQYAACHRINDFETPFSESQFAATYPELMRRAGYHTGFIGKYGVGNKMPANRFDYWAGFPGQGHYFPKGPSGPHLTELMGGQAVEFLAKTPNDKPFCLSVSFKAPHVQDQDPKQFLHSQATAKLYADVRIPVPETADPAYIRMLPFELQRSEARRRWAVRFGTPELFQESVKSYYRLITEVDTVVGRVCEQLRKTGADRNTVIVYSSDNGFYLGEHGLAGKWFMHEESIRTPLIVCDPRMPAARQGRRVRQMTLNIDIAPTLLEAAGIPAPPMQGRSVRQLMESGRAPDWRREWFYEQHFTSGGWLPHTEGLRNERWKYSLLPDAEPVFEELYDLESDPKEKRNLAGQTEHARQLESMRARYRMWRERLQAWTPGQSWSDPA